jgi:hypothetical protein
VALSIPNQVMTMAVITREMGFARPIANRAVFISMEPFLLIGQRENSSTLRRQSVHKKTIGNPQASLVASATRPECRIERNHLPASRAKALGY